MTFSNANRNCYRLNGHLVTLSSMAENEFVFGLNPTHDLWIGYTDKEKEGSWRWVDKSGTSAFTNWASGGRSADRKATRDCAVIWGALKTPKWSSQNCNNKKHFVCERGGSI